MSWTRLDDRWTDRRELEVLSFEHRWHYLAMIQWCSRTERLDGLLTPAQARRASDVDDPDAAAEALMGAGLVELCDDGRLRLVQIHEHVPPQGVRDASAQAKIRMQRMRAHKAGDHSLCRPDHCSDAPVVTDLVTRNTGTGQDGTGQASKKDHEEVEDQDRNASPTPKPDPWDDDAEDLECLVPDCQVILFGLARRSGFCAAHDPSPESPAVSWSGADDKAADRG